MLPGLHWLAAAVLLLVSCKAQRTFGACLSQRDHWLWHDGSTADAGAAQQQDIKQVIPAPEAEHADMAKGRGPHLYVVSHSTFQ